jgi:hypothetical protein
MPTLAADYTNIPRAVVAELEALAGTTTMIRLSVMPLIWMDRHYVPP